MFEKFFEGMKESRYARQWSKGPLGQAVTEHSREFWSESSLGSYSEEFKSRIVLDLTEKLFGIAHADDPHQAFRNALAIQALYFAHLSVLVLRPSDRAVELYNSQYISCDLRGHIRKAVECDDTLREHNEPPVQDATLYSRLSGMRTVAHYHLNGLARANPLLEPKTQNSFSIWFEPFVKSMLIWAENSHRTKLSLVSLCPDAMFSLQHYAFRKVVEQCHPNPLQVWERDFKVSHRESS